MKSHFRSWLLQTVLNEGTFGLRQRRKCQETGENCVIRSFVTCAVGRTLFWLGSRGKDLVSKHEGEKPFGILRRKWEGNINP